MQKQRGDPFVIFFKMYTEIPICILSDNDKKVFKALQINLWQDRRNPYHRFYTMRTCDIHKIGLDGHCCLPHKYIYPGDW